MAHADWIIDPGTGTGHDGGRIVFECTPGLPRRRPLHPHRRAPRGLRRRLLYALLRLLIDLLILRGCPTADRDLELLVLRQQLLVLRRTAPRPRWRTADRMILAAQGRKLSAGALLLVQPATVL